MKILRKGAKKAKPLRGDCQYCGCRVECSEEETSAGAYDPRDQTQLLYVKCPQCKADHLYVY